MEKYKYFAIIILSVIYPECIGQPEYKVGTSQFSIEPDKSMISLHLGGYGIPRDGRFSLEWIRIENLPETTAICVASGYLFTVSDQNLLWRDPSQKNSLWKKAGIADNIKSIAGFEDMIFAITENNELLRAKAGPNVLWKKLGSVDNSVRSLAASDNLLYAANETGSLWYADLSKGGISWSEIPAIKGIINLSANREKLFALTNDGIIYQTEPSHKGLKWLKIAYKNGISIKESIRQIVVTDDGIFGISDENILYGGQHRTEGNLTVRSMAINKDESTVIIVNVDVCGLNDTFVGLVKKQIWQNFKIPPSAVFINSSHTHFAPVSQDWLTWQEPGQKPDSIYLYTIIRNGILNAVNESVKMLNPAEIYFGRGNTDIGYNRSLPDHPELYDGSVDVIKVKYTESNSETCLFIASCHPVFSTAGKLHYTISANYPGIARKLVEEKTGASNSLFLQGTAGDINPRDNGEYISGKKLANEVIAVLNRPMIELRGGMSFFLDTINIPVTPWAKNEIIRYREENINKSGDIYAERNIKWCDLMLKNYNEGTMPVSLPVYVHTLNIGNWKLVGFSRETTTGYGLGVKNLWPDKLISVAGYTNDVSSYLPTSMHIVAGNYEGLDSFFWYGMPAVFPENVDRTILSTIASLQH